MTTPFLFIAAFPPPVHGQSYCNQFLAEEFEARGLKLCRVDMGEQGRSGLWGKTLRLKGHLLAMLKLLSSSGPAYISANSNRGLWLTALLALLGRLRGRTLLIHHHSYSRSMQRDPEMVALAKAGGSHAIQLALCSSMAEGMKAQVPEIAKIITLNNTMLIDKRFQNLTKPDFNLPVTISHLSNLTIEKGIGRFVDAAIDLANRRDDVRFLVAGPISNPEAQACLNIAQAQLKDRFHYLGPVYDHEKLNFFAQTDIFVFPSTYKNEAQPLVIFEAMASGAKCISSARGCMADDIGNAGTALNEEKITSSHLADVLDAEVSNVINDPDGARSNSRSRFLSLQEIGLKQLDSICDFLIK